MANATRPHRRNHTRVVAASFLGTTMEWYDFFIYGTAAATVFPKLFFPHSGALAGTLLALLTYAVGYANRPLGAVLFGHFGDRLGRKRLLVVSLTMMGLSTLAIGLLPSYQVVGVAAPIALIVLRFVQGLGLGGEWGGAALMVAENVGAQRRGFWGSFVQLGAPVGLLAGNAAFALAALLAPGDAYTAWGWRLPFLSSGVLIFVGLYARMQLNESPAFTAASDRNMLVKAPVRVVVREHWRQLITAVGVRTGSDVAFYVASSFILVYATQHLHLPNSVALTAVIAGAAGEIVGIPLFGALSDHINRRWVIMFGAATSVGWAFVFFPLLDSKVTGLIYLASFIGVFLNSAMWSPMAAFIPELFPTNVRYTGSGIGFQMSSVLGGAVAPLVAVTLLATYGSGFPVALYVTAMLLIVIVSASCARRTHDQSIAASTQQPSNAVVPT